MLQLSTIRRLEAVGFRAWPAASVHYDGSWAVRLTASHPSRRLNSVNPLDPSDYLDIPTRIHRIETRFNAYSRPLVFRLSPLAPPQLIAHFDTNGWQRINETCVMTANLDDMDLESGIHLLPIKDVGRFADATIAMSGDPADNKPGLAEVLESIRPPKGMFVLEDDNGPIATALCVHDNDMAGLFEVTVRADARDQGYGRSIVRAALRWAASQGASTGWLQVEQANTPGRTLYERIGFDERYRYNYRTRSEKHK